MTKTKTAELWWIPGEGFWQPSDGPTAGFVPISGDDFRAYLPASAVRYTPEPESRVFFSGDVIPGGVCVQAENGDEYRSKDDRILIAGGPYVEVHPMTRKEWRTAVDRAHAAHR